MIKEYYEDCKLGDRVVTPGRTITETDVVMFAAFSSDWNSVHVDKEHAASTPFKQRIAHGLLGLVAGTCLLSRLGWILFWPRSTLCITGLERVRFVRPIYIGDTIHLEAEIVEMVDGEDGNGTITTRLQIKNQDRKLVITGRIKTLAGRRPPG